MARITKGILGGFSGKVGTIVGANWRGQDIIRSTPKPSSRPPSEKQLLQQSKFKLVISFLQPINSIQKRYFGSGTGSKSRVNMAVSYTINEAVEVVGDVPQLMYNKVLITRGDLAGFQNVSATPQAAQAIVLNWEDNSVQGNANAADKVNAVCYCEELGTFEIFESLGERSFLTAAVTLQSYYAGKTVQVWVYFNNTTETLACNSPYLGTFTIL
ncbi:hypothetical protein K0U91_13050 [Chryseobacterium chendengshani]|uniref:DUF6266 family protein n=1 Tax=Chryseobacterium sp. LJ668 TaxID=2864040 RepID=UPI001C68A41B|nr:DUF6266 family protein [Chryseobacterium sp. LJ668]MBW8523696.1 hypothetical protein [Chryseobacterium sp. LJ668]QYK15976.1 hypothetical protein K0U91_13050 [Chryseobacterium sp. LJ668]